MFSRSEFLHGLIVATLSTASPLPSPAPAASPSTDPARTCLQSPSLPYDRPLELKLPVLDGPDFHLSAYRGRAVILNIFATWCGPCNYEMPYLVEASKDYADRGLTIIGIDDRESDNPVRAFREKYSIPYPLAMDRQGSFTRVIETGAADGSTSIPSSLFITPDGFLYCYLVNSIGRRELATRIEAFLSDAPPTRLTDAALSAQPPTKPPP
jgi:thiol-disulfide isomerase/thioredoxin